MDDEQQLKKLDLALGKLAPKGTWLNEVLENIWRAETETEAGRIAESARNTFDAIGIRERLWVGDRVDCDCGGSPHGDGCALVLNGIEQNA